MIEAPLERVFAALVDPESLGVWLPPDGMSGRFERFDARPGGSYRFVLTCDDPATGRGKATADTDIVEARFVVARAGGLFVALGGRGGQGCIELCRAVTGHCVQVTHNPFP